MSENKAKNASQSAQERRSFFRVTEDIVLDYCVVKADTAENEDASAQFPESAMLDLFSAFRQIDNESTQLLHSIGESNRNIADYLINLNKKLDLLTQHMVANRTHNSQLATMQVNLSEGGIAFATEKAIYKGSYLALRLLFLPSYISIALFAKVIRSESKGEQRHQLAARFYRIQDQQRQILSKQIMQAQINAKRRAKG